MDYNYLSQQKREIRLVRFDFKSHKDSSKHPATPISLLLQQGYRDEFEYTALSYVWGPTTDPATILIDNVAVSIRNNLYQALLQLQEFQISSWIWVDAICINQQDNTEKAWHVNQMRSIYQNAQSVYYWLEPCAHDSDFAIDLLDRRGRDSFDAGVLEFAKQKRASQDVQLLRSLQQTRPDIFLRLDKRHMSIENNTDTAGSVHEDPSVYHAADFLIKVALDHSGDHYSARFTKALEQLLLRDFWHRLWTFQELAVARNAILICGNRRLSADHFDSALAIGDFRIPKGILSQISNTPGRSLWFLNMNMFRLQGFQIRRQRQAGQRPFLLDVLLSGLGLLEERPMYSTTDPRDVIFGLLGVVCDADKLGISADYSRSVVDVFTTTTKALIRRDTRYYFAFSTFPKNVMGLPSWVSDWSRLGKEGIASYPVTYNRPHHSAALDTRQPEYSAADHEDDLHVLLLSGIRVSRIVSVMGTIPENRIPTNQGAAVAYRTFYDKVSNYCKENAITDDGMILRTLLCDDYTHYVLSEQTIPLVRNLGPNVFRGELLVNEQDFTSEETAMLFRFAKHDRRSPSIESAFYAFASKVWVKIRANAKRRTLFVLENGKLCLGPCNVAVGDLAVVVFGSNAPLILRSDQQDDFTFVGDAYVDGIMYGEMIGEQAKEEVFRIV